MEKNCNTVEFPEHPFVDYTTKTPTKYEVSALGTSLNPSLVIEDRFNMQGYCNVLLSKVMTLPQSELKDFICHQVGKVSKPFVWLNKLEKLIAENEDLFEKPRMRSRFTKLYTLIEHRREKLNENSDSGSFDFSCVKSHLKSYNTPEDKLCYLMEVKADYLQNKPKKIDPAETPLDEKISIEMKLIKDQTKLRRTKLNLSSETHVSIDKKSPPYNGGLREDSGGLSPKMKFNGRTNVFVDLFYQMTKEMLVDGKPLLPWTKQETTDFICLNFNDENGNDLSPSTVRTILSPSREEKRPNLDKKITFEMR